MTLTIPRMAVPILINDITPRLSSRWDTAERDARCKLATAYRLVTYLGWDDVIYGHLTHKIPESDNHFLINPFGLHFNEISASSLLTIDTDGHVIDPGTSGFPFQRTGYVIHSAIHEGRPDLTSVFHVHTREGIAVSCVPDVLRTVTQTGAFLGPLSYLGYRGIVVTEEEKDHIRKSFPSPSQHLIMRNHGLISGGGSVEEAFANLISLVDFARSYVDTGFLTDDESGSRVRLSEDVIASTVEGADVVREGVERGVAEFEALARQLDYAGLQTGIPYSERSRNLLQKNMEK